jgi:large subunit ribosomal protein L21
LATTTYLRAHICSRFCWIADTLSSFDKAYGKQLKSSFARFGRVFFTVEYSFMYAVIKTGGKQYRVTSGQKLKIEQIPADVNAEVVLDQVLMVGEGDSVRLGQPVLEGASVKATVLEHARAPKVKIFKMRRRKHYQKRQGHRQNYTLLRIDSIVA